MWLLEQTLLFKSIVNFLELVCWYLVISIFVISLQADLSCLFAVCFHSFWFCAPVQCYIQSSLLQYNVIYRVLCSSTVLYTEFFAPVQCHIQGSLLQYSVIYRVLCSSTVSYTEFFASVQRHIQSSLLYYSVMYIVLCSNGW